MINGKMSSNVKNAVFHLFPARGILKKFCPPPGKGGARHMYAALFIGVL